MKLLDYIFYRCAKLAKDWFEYSLYAVWGGLISSCVFVNFLWAVLYLILGIFDFPLTAMWYFISGNAVSLGAILLVFTEERYKKLDDNYSGNTKHYKLYGWLIFFLVIASFVVLFLSFQISDVETKTTHDFVNDHFKFNIKRR